MYKYLMESLVEHGKKTTKNPLYTDSQVVNFWGSIVLSPDGKFREIRSHNKETIPMMPQIRTSGTLPIRLFCEDMNYTIKGTSKKQIKKATLYQEYIQKAYDALGLSEIQAVKQFYEAEEEVQKAREAFTSLKKVSGCIGFVIQSPDNPLSTPLHLKQEVQDYWSQEHQTYCSGSEGVCSICGETRSLLAKSPRTAKFASRLALNLQYDSSTFVNNNVDSRLHGDEQADLSFANLCLPCFCYAHSAIQALSFSEDSSFSLLTKKEIFGEARKKGPAYFGWVSEGDFSLSPLLEDDPWGDIAEDDFDELFIKLFMSPIEGETPPDLQDVTFHFLTLSGELGRLAIRNYQTTALTDVQANVEKFFHYQKKVPNYFTPSFFSHNFISKFPEKSICSVFSLLRALTPETAKGKATKKLSDLGKQLVYFALFGTPFDARLVIQTVLDRLLRKQPMTKRMVVLTMMALDQLGVDMSEEMRSPWFIVGQKLGLAQHIQLTHNPKVNRSVFDVFLGRLLLKPIEVGEELFAKVEKEYLTTFRRQNKWQLVQPFSERMQTLSSFLLTSLEDCGILTASGLRYKKLGVKEKGELMLGYWSERQFQKEDRERRVKKANTEKECCNE